MFLDTGILLIFLVLIGLSIDVGLTYHADHAIFLGVSPMETTYLLGIIGIFNILGKVTIGKLLDILHLWMFALTVIVMLLHCVAFSLGDFFPSLVGQSVVSAMFGFTFGSYYNSSALLMK